MLLRRTAGDVGVHRRGTATTQMRPRRRNPEGAWVLLGSAIVRLARVARPRMLGSAIVRLAKIARPRMRAIQALLCFSHSRSRARDDPRRDRLRRAGRLSGLSLPVARPRIRALRTTECQDNHSVTGTLCVLASLPQPELEVRSLRNAARQYPCARPFVLSPRAPDRCSTPASCAEPSTA